MKNLVAVMAVMSLALAGQCFAEDLDSKHDCSEHGGQMNDAGQCVMPAGPAAVAPASAVAAATGAISVGAVVAVTVAVVAAVAVAASSGNNSGGGTGGTTGT